MNLPQKPIGTIDAVKLIWTASYTSLKAKPKSPLFISLLMFAAAVVLLTFFILVLGVSGFTELATGKSTISASMLMCMVLMSFMLSFFTTALLTRGFAYLTNNPGLAQQTWSIAKSRFLYLFAAMMVIYFANYGINALLTLITHTAPTLIKVVTSLIALVMVIFFGLFPFVVYSPIVNEKAPVFQALGEGIRLIRKDWLRVLPTVLLAFCVPTIGVVFLAFILYLIPVIGVILIFLLLCLYFPWTMILSAYVNIIVYHNAKLASNTPKSSDLSVTTA